MVPERTLYKAPIDSIKIASGNAQFQLFIFATILALTFKMIHDSSPKLCPKIGTSVEMSVAIDLEDSEDPKKASDVKERLQTMQLLAKKLKVQLGMCAAGVILTIAVYFLIWYFAECWALPFQEGPCQRAKHLPLMATDRNTLADAVDEFTLALRPQITKFRDAFLMNDHKERRRRFNSAKSEIGQLIHRHSVDLFAFGALKREDHRLEKMKEANLSTYFLIFLFSLITVLFSCGVAIAVECCKLTVTSEQEVSSAEENENLQNARLKQLKRQIPVLYTVTFVCIAAEVALFTIFFVGHYYSGSSPIITSSTSGCDCDYLNISTALKATLDKRFAKLDNAMESSALEVRQSIWQYESETIETAIEHYLDLKKYTVDRRTMPGRIALKVSFEWYILVPWLAIVTLCMYHIAFAVWALEEGRIVLNRTLSKAPINPFEFPSRSYFKCFKFESLIPIFEMMNYIESSKLCLTKRNRYKTSIAIDSKDPKNSCIFAKERQNYVKKRLQKMELLAMKLECQRDICAFAVILTLAAYFLIWYFAECWVLPFQESPCIQPRDLPLISTNQSTLAEEVDEFILALRSQITKFHDAIHLPDQVKRHRLFNITKTEIGQLMHLHSEDLSAFGALKGEDNRIWDMNTAIIGTYILMALVSMPVFVFITTIPKILAEYKLPETRNTKRSSAKESENLQNARLKQLKRQIPMINIETLICIAAEITLLSVFIAGHYYSGSSPTVLGPQRGNNNTDYLNFSTKLESTLNKRFAKLDNAMESPALELRQSIWQYESEAIETAIEHHLSLKKHNVDRRTMPRNIGNEHSK